MLMVIEGNENYRRLLFLPENRPPILAATIGTAPQDR